MPDNGNRDSYFGGYDGAYGYGANCNTGVRTLERKFPVDWDRLNYVQPALTALRVY